MTPQSVGKKSFHCFFLDPSETNFWEKELDFFFAYAFGKDLQHTAT